MRPERIDPASWLTVRCCLMLFFVCLVGCSHVPSPETFKNLPAAEQVGPCMGFFSSLDQAVQNSRARDAGSFRIKGYPYLRVNRFLASFRDDLSGEHQFEAWVARLKELDRRARHNEIKNLTAAERDVLQLRSGNADLDQRVGYCGDFLASIQLASPASRVRLRQAARVPDEYSSIKRAAGLYPFPLLFISDGVKKWQKSAKENFTNSDPNKPHLQRYVPPALGPSAATSAGIVEMVRRDALGVPIYSPELTTVLFSLYAPVWEVETRGDSDRIGAPIWGGNHRLQIDTHKPVSYHLLSYTRFGGQILTQLNYVVWFPARPKKGPLDLLGGHLDGINYRVTLDIDGQPLVFETVHNCGCYLAFYPTPKLVPKATVGCVEPPLLLQAPVLDTASERMVISMESGAHHVRHLYAVSSVSSNSDLAYVVTDYDDLRSLPIGESGARKSMFGEDGLAAGTERLERWLLWPAGVASPGAMRQWGRHAVAFMGERHLDDPYLLQDLFEYVRR